MASNIEMWLMDGARNATTTGISNAQILYADGASIEPPMFTDAATMTQARAKSRLQGRKIMPEAETR